MEQTNVEPRVQLVLAEARSEWSSRVLHEGHASPAPALGGSRAVPDARGPAMKCPRPGCENTLEIVVKGSNFELWGCRHCGATQKTYRQQAKMRSSQLMMEIPGITQEAIVRIENMKGSAMAEPTKLQRAEEQAVMCERASVLLVIQGLRAYRAAVEAALLERHDDGLDEGTVARLISQIEELETCGVREEHG